MNQTTSPIAPQRLHSMDAMRGFAIFGIFMVNIQVMGMPFEWAMNSPHRVDRTKLRMLFWNDLRCFPFLDQFVVY